MKNIQKIVKVVNINGMLLDSTTPKTAKKLLDAGKAIVIEKNPFTIKLTKLTISTK